MGNTWGSPFPLRQGNNKRKCTSDAIDEAEVPEDALHTPQKKRLKTTSEYIYETLFLNGENSDVKIEALGKEWSLHKLYLCQSSYFAGMFSGAWRESTMDVVKIDIPDQNVDCEALSLAFGSLYQDEVEISPAKAISVLATANLLNLVPLMQQAVDIMAESISSNTVCSFHAAALLYAQNDLREKCLQWLRTNIMSCQSVRLLKDISVDLMTILVSSSQLFVMQVEVDVYSLLNKWMFLQINTSWDGVWTEVSDAAEDYYKTETSGQKNSFLETTQGVPFIQVYKQLRLQHIMNDYTSVKLCEDGKIIPNSWLQPFYRQQWLQMLNVEQKVDLGPHNLSPAVFEAQAMRCGRVLHLEVDYCWRWTGYCFGFDLLVTFSNRLLAFKRNTHSQSCPGSVSLQDKRRVMFKVTAASLNKLGQTLYTTSTEISSLNLSKDQENVVLRLDRKATFPIHLSIQYLLYSPHDVSQNDIV